MSVQLLLFVIALLLLVNFWNWARLMAISKKLFPPQQECHREDKPMTRLLRRLWKQDEGQDIAEYAVMLAFILVLVVGTIRLVGSNASNVFSNTASAIQ